MSYAVESRSRTNPGTPDKATTLLLGRYTSGIRPDFARPVLMSSDLLLAPRKQLGLCAPSPTELYWIFLAETTVMIQVGKTINCHRISHAPRS